jgi:hypothetical protein
VPLQHDLGAGRHLQASAPSPTLLSTTSVRLPRSRPANWYSDSVSGTGVTAPRMVAGSAPSATAIGNGRPGWPREVAEVQRAAAVGQPAHDDLARPITCCR